MANDTRGLLRVFLDNYSISSSSETAEGTQTPGLARLDLSVHTYNSDPINPLACAECQMLQAMYWGKVLEREASLGCWTCRCGWVTLERVRVRTFKSRTAFLSVCPKSSLLSSLLLGLTYGLGRCQRPSLASTETFFFSYRKGQGVREGVLSVVCMCSSEQSLRAF